MRLFFQSFKSLLSNNSDSYFDTCEKMPLYNFKMFIETNDLKVDDEVIVSQKSENGK